VSDVPQGEGWWLGVDGRYYPPERHPDVAGSGDSGPPDSGVAVNEAGAEVESGSPVAVDTLEPAVDPPNESDAPDPWYHSWLAILLGLVLFFPAGLWFLWASGKSRRVKVGLSAVTALVVIGFAAFSLSTSSDRGDVAMETARDRSSPTEQPAGSTTTIESTTTAVPVPEATTTSVAPPPAESVPTEPPPPEPPPEPVGPPAPAPFEAPIEPAVSDDPFAGETPAQRTARVRASEILKTGLHSRPSLIRQLEGEGLASVDAAYGVDVLVVDWNDQAARKGAEYLKLRQFTRQELYDQLSLDGYAGMELDFGLSANGL